MAGGGRGATGVVQVSSVGEPATARSAGVAGPTEPYDCRADRGHRTGGREVSRGAALEDPSRSGSADRAGLRADHRPSGAVSVWQADRVLLGTGAVGRFERRSATTGPHHETMQLTVALLARRTVAAHGTPLPTIAHKAF